MRTLAMLKAAGPWSLTSPREKLIKIGAKGRQPWPLRDVPDGRGRSVATDFPGNPVADRPAAGTTCAGMKGRWRQMRQTTAAEVRLDTGEATRFRASAQSTGGFDPLLPAGARFAVIQEARKGAILPHNHPECGESRLNQHSNVVVGVLGRTQALSSKPLGRARRPSSEA
jgi:hypothetical protein